MKFISGNCLCRHFTRVSLLKILKAFLSSHVLSDFDMDFEEIVDSMVFAYVRDRFEIVAKAWEKMYSVPPPPPDWCPKLADAVDREAVLSISRSFDLTAAENAKPNESSSDHSRHTSDDKPRDSQTKIVSTQTARVRNSWPPMSALPRRGLRSEKKKKREKVAEEQKNTEEVAPHPNISVSELSSLLRSRHRMVLRNCESDSD